ncbi:MAG: hypothetical protein RXS23_00245 [Metallosphaera yellowstonensis]|jgi:hypothetical protein
MTLQTVLNVTSKIFHSVNFNAEPLSMALVAVGLIVLMLVAFGGIVYGLFKVAKVVPHMTTKQFILFLMLVALALVIIGIILP